MAAFLHDNVLDNGLSYLTTNGNSLLICSGSVPTTYSAANTATLGSKTSPTVGSPAAGSPDGRQVTISAITDGTISTGGTAAVWALVDVGNSRLLAANTLSSSVAVTTGQFSLASFTIRIPAAA
jgi:hypothetical protein